jgi:hypothetical protein
MSDGVFISDRPQLAIARQTVSFASLGLNDPTLTRIIYEVGNPYLSYIPTDEFNPISGITEGKSYLLYLNAFFDGSPALANAVLTNLIPQTTTNVFADERVVFLCTSSVSFATAGITTSNTRLITLVSEGYFTSYDPNDSINGIDGFVEGELYDIDPITDIDLHLYGVTKIRYSDEVLYLDSLEDVVVTNPNPDATLPLAGEEILVRNATTGVWENQPIRVNFVADEASLPTTGTENIIYVAKAENTSWYWDGSAYQQIGGGGGGTYTDADARAAISLTTTGTSGAATYDDTTGILNIPEYSGGGSGSGKVTIVTTTPYSVLSDDEYLLVESGGLYVTLPDPTLWPNRKIVVSHNKFSALLGSSTGVAFSTPYQPVDGTGSVLTGQNIFTEAEYISNGTNWVKAASSLISLVNKRASSTGNNLINHTNGVNFSPGGSVNDQCVKGLKAGTNVTITDDGNDLTINASGGTSYTDEMAQDATAALFAAGTHTGITFSYDDAGNKISAAVTGGSSYLHKRLKIFYADEGSINSVATDLNSFTLPANTFVNDGDQVRFAYRFLCVSNANSKTLTWTFGAFTQSFSLQASNTVVTIEIIVTRDTSTSARISFTSFRDLSYGTSSNNTQATTLNFAATLATKMTVNTPTNNSVVAKVTTIDYIPNA